MATDKDTIYIDIDDEITGIIDKLRASDGKVVALVLPKRSGVFQSIVNMKLLKRAADTSKKHLVLITSESGLLPLAGAAGVHVAKTLNSKPEIPSAPQGFDDSEETVDESETDAEPEVDPNAPVGKLAGAAAAGAIATDDKGVETLVLDDEDIPPEEEPEKPAPKSFEPPKKKNSKLKVPNFERFRLVLALLVLVLILVGAGFAYATVSLPKATINVKTDATNVDTNLDLTLSTSAKALDAGSGTVPAKLETQPKTYTQQVPTTGQKNNGNKAAGSISLTNCSSQDGSVTIPAGSSFTSGGNTYISQDDVTVDGSTFNFSHSKCTSHPSATVNVLAQSGGTAFNGATSFTAGSPYNGVTGIGNTSGGTDNIVQSVNQNDINSAKSKISTNDSGAKSDLEAQAKKEGLYPIESTFSTGTPVVTTSANVGEVASTVTVTETVTYTMFAVHQEDLKALVDGNIKTQIDTAKQSILDDGLDSAVYNVNNVSATGAALSLSTKATAGPSLDVNSIKTEVAGKRAGAIKDQLSSNPDVTSVDVKISPFWVSTAPKKTDRITVIIAKPTTTAKSSSSNGSKP